MQYKISELAQKAGVTKRTIHYYISKGLLMQPEGSGVASTYDDSHLERILLIKKLQARYMPLNKIREYLLEGKDIDCGADTKDNFSSRQNEKTQFTTSSADIYMRENICNIFEIHYTQENAQKYKYIIENVRKYVEKMLED
ncbi:MAG: MerR family transcriptional regulator [Candidatus Gastranaerophilales bacterium]|nr:MerR family transcriptional regulator [Candidatus Gastranaerophilales bacterium]